MGASDYVTTNPSAQNNTTLSSDREDCVRLRRRGSYCVERALLGVFIGSNLIREYDGWSEDEIFWVRVRCV